MLPLKLCSVPPKAQPVCRVADQSVPFNKCVHGHVRASEVKQGIHLVHLFIHLLHTGHQLQLLA